VKMSVKPKFFYGYIVVLAAFVIMVVVFGTVYTFGVFFKPLSAEFGWTRTVTSGAYSLKVLLGSFLGIIAGRVNDKVGPRLLVTVCGFFLGLGYLLMSQIGAIWHLYLFLGVMVAIGTSGAYVPMVSTIARWFVKQRGFMTGIVVSGIGFGTLIMPPVATCLISAYGWRTAYRILGIIGSVLIILAAQFLRRDPSQVGLLPYGEGEANQGGSNMQGKGFSLQEAIHTRQLWMACAMFFCFGFGLQAIMVHVVPHATDLGISAISAANILAIIGGAGIMGRVMMGSAGDRIGNKMAITICFVLLSAILFWLIAAKEVWTFYLFAAIFGFAYGGAISLQSPTVAELFGLSSHGVILGVTAFGMSLGEAISPLLAGKIFDVAGSYDPAFLICATLSIIAIALAMLLRPPSSKALTENI